ncbi:MAG: acyl-CoA thioesterase [Solirubrobacteraceae bacterium]
MAIDSKRGVRTEVPLRWRDLDLLGHLNQAVYHELLEEGRGALFASLEDNTFPFVLAHVSLDYRHEVRRDHGHVVVVSRVGRVGRTSVTTEERIELPDGTLAAEGTAVLVAWDMQARRSRELSETERAALGEPSSSG